jgi:hypothetical protein
MTTENQTMTRDSIHVDSARRNLKTYLVKFGTRTFGARAFANLHYKDMFSTGLIRAESLYMAYDRALRSHVPEAFDEHGAIPGEWEEHQIDSGALRLSFMFDDDCAEVDAGTVFWIEKIREVEAHDVATLEAYLRVW